MERTGLTPLRPGGNREATASDAELIGRCRLGDQHAWACLVGRYERLVLSIARSQGLFDGDAEDVTQTVFLELVSALDRLEDTQRLGSWLATVTKRQAWRRRDAVRRIEPCETDRLDRPDRDQPIERSTDTMLLLAALDAVDEHCRLLLLRLYFSDRDTSYEAVAADLQMPVGSIGPTRARCLEKLRRELIALGFTI